jgi:predicted transcriptional regulator
VSKVISTKIDDKTDEILGKMAGELDVSKSWVVQQAIKQYLERYDSYLSDVRIASLSETKGHKTILKEYGL